jgi:GPH family glycoside/pentoside/hexuronide:cation symporter
MWMFILLPAAVAVLQIIALAPYDLQHRLPQLKAEIRARHQEQGTTQS